MIAFEFIPPMTGTSCDRRIDLARLAGHFGERDEVIAPGATPQVFARVAVMVLILLGAIGDTVLIAQREALASCLAATQPVPAVDRATLF